MRHVAIIALLFLAVAASAAVTQEQEITGEFVIRGYASGEFAVRGQVENQLNELVQEIKGKIDGRTLYLTIIGSADITGSSPANDRLALSRAEQVRAVLSASFPEARITAWSRGDAENVRQVKVEYRIIPVLPAAEKTEEGVVAEKVALTYGLKFYIILGFLAITIIWILSLLIRVRPRKSSRFRWITNLKVNDAIYDVQIQVKDGVYVSPFRTKSGLQVTRKTLKGMKDSLRGCLKGHEFASQKEALIAKMKILILR